MVFFIHYNTTGQMLEKEYPGYIEYVPEVFLDDPPVSHYFSITVAIFFIILLIISVGGNSLVVFIYAR